MSRDLLDGGEVAIPDAQFRGGLRSMPKVVIANEKREIEVPEGANLRDALRGAGVQVYKGMHRFLNCHGLGLCGTCTVLVKKGMENLAPNGMTKADWEKRQAQVKQNGSAP